MIAADAGCTTCRRCLAARRPVVAVATQAATCDVDSAWSTRRRGSRTRTWSPCRRRPPARPTTTRPHARPPPRRPRPWPWPRRNLAPHNTGTYTRPPPAACTRAGTGWLAFNGTFSTNRLYRAITVGKYVTQGQQTTHIHNKTMKQYNKPRKSCMHTLRPGLSGDDPLATIRLPQRGLSSQSLGK